MAVGDVFEVRLITQSGNQVGINVRHYRSSAITGSGVTLTDIAFNLASVFGPLYAPLMSNAAEFRGVGVRRRIPAPVSAEVFSTLPAVQGTRAGDQLPKQTSGVITLRTALAGRQNRGRLYVPFPAESSNGVGGTPEATYVADLITLADSLDDPRIPGFAPNTETLLPVIAHRPSYTHVDIALAVPRGIWGTQRRRGSFGAANVSPI